MGYTKLVYENHISDLSEDITEAQLRLNDRQKLALFLKSSSAFQEQLRVRDMFEVYN